MCHWCDHVVSALCVVNRVHGIERRGEDGAGWILFCVFPFQTRDENGEAYFSILFRNTCTGRCNT